MLIDFLIGLFAANALPHFLFGKLDARVLGLFGYSARGNIAYALLCSTISLALFLYQYGQRGLLTDGKYLGVLTVVASYYCGWQIIDKFLTNRERTVLDPANQDLTNQTDQPT